MRAVRRCSSALRLMVDGATVDAIEGDSLLAALLLNGRAVRRLEFGGEPRAGFCLMGVCQDCWVVLGNGERVQACTTPAADGMVVWTDPQQGDGDV